MSRVVLQEQKGRGKSGRDVIYLDSNYSSGTTNSHYDFIGSRNEQQLDRMFPIKWSGYKQQFDKMLPVKHL